MTDTRASRERFLRTAAASALALGALRPRSAPAADAPAPVASAAAGAAAPAPSPAATPGIVIIGKDKWLFAAWDHLDDPEDAKIQTQLDLVAKARDLFATKGIQLMYLAVPMKARFYQNLLPDGTVMSEGVKSRYGRLLQWCAQRKLMTVDLNAIIAPVGGVSGQTVFYQTDQHWTAWSAEAAGAAIAEFITKNIQLPKANGGGSHLNPWETEHRVGDLTELLPKDQQAQYGLQAYVVREPGGSDLAHQNQQGNDLLVPDPAIRVVGNSFCRPDWGLPQKISNVLNRPVGLTWLRGDTGPWKILLNYVESPDFKKKPSLIVWQFPEAQMADGPMSPGWWFESSLMTPEQWLDRMTAAVNAL
jgi:alginate O-acetyltransferase complex protein AlgJ